MSTPDKETMLCEIYRSPKKPDTYLYMPIGGDWEELPANLQQLFSPPSLVTKIQVYASRKLARLTGAELMQHLRDPGYYLQIPPPPDDLLKQFRSAAGSDS